MWMMCFPRILFRRALRLQSSIGLAAGDLTHSNRNSSWKIFRSGREWLQVTLPLPGEHNALNATAAAALAGGQGIDPASIAQALSTFLSVKRRLEVRAVAAGVTIVDDFAHHPTAIRETLKALRAAYPGQKLWAVLEPRSNTLRRNVFERELVESLALADHIVVAGVFKQESIAEGEKGILKRWLPSWCVLVTMLSISHRGRHRPGNYSAVKARGRRGHPIQRRLRRDLWKLPRYLEQQT